MVRIASLLSARIKANAQERSRDPIEIFDELDRKRVEGEFRPELIETTDQPSVQKSMRPSIASTSTSKNAKSSPISPSPSFSFSSTSCSSRSTSPESLPRDFPKRKLPTITVNHAPRRLPLINKAREPYMPAAERRRVECPQISIPILRSHRILLGDRGIARRKLPTLDSIIENPMNLGYHVASPLSEVKKSSTMIGNSCPENKVFGNAFFGIRCNGIRTFGDNLVAPRHPLIRTETETTYLTSSLGDSHHAS